VGKALLAIEARIGQLSRIEPRIYGGPYKSPVKGGAVKPKHERLGMTFTQMKRAQAIASHPEEVEEIIDETVRVTKEFLEKHPDMVGVPMGTPISSRKIAKFLDGNWNKTRVGYSLERLGLIEKGEIDKEAVENLPTERAARDFVRAVKRVKNVTSEQQKRVVEKIIETQDFGEESIELAVLEENHGFQRRKKEEEKNFFNFNILQVIDNKQNIIIVFKRPILFIYNSLIIKSCKES